MKIQHMRRQWIPGPSFSFPRVSPRVSLRTKKAGLGTRLSYNIIIIMVTIASFLKIVAKHGISNHSRIIGVGLGKRLGMLNRDGGGKLSLFCNLKYSHS